jgi:iron complex transport system substrate-binding protein
MRRATRHRGGTAQLPAALLAGALVITSLAAATPLRAEPDPGRAEPATVTDAGGRRVTITDTRRIVAIGGAITEILYALGAEHRIVAVDSTSVHPPQALADKPSVGYMRQLSPEGILAMAPSLVLASEGAGPPAAVAVLKAAQVPFVQVADRYTIAGVIEKVRLVADTIGEPARGACLIDALRADVATLERERVRLARPLRVLFVLSFVGGRAMVAGRDTAADGIVRLAGAENAMPDLVGYKPVGDEAIIAAQPDVVLMMNRPGETATASVLDRPAFVGTPAGRARALIVMDGQYLLGFGPRTARAARDLAARLAALAGDTPAAAATTATTGAGTRAVSHDATVADCRR